MKSVLSIIVLVIIVILIAQFVTYQMRSYNRGRFGARSARSSSAERTSSATRTSGASRAPIIAATDEMQLLRDSYELWSVAREQMNIIIRAINAQSRPGRDNARNIYEARAILERWHISSQNFARVTIDASSDITRKMRQEFLDKRIFAERDINSIIDQLLHVTPDLAPSSVGARIDDDGVITFGAFKTTYLPARIELMRNIAHARGYSDLRIITAALRYASLVPSGQQWSLSPETYDTLVTKYGATLEGFASPFNSQIMRYIMSDIACDEGARYAFCSLFPDIDRAFGSCGNFFNCDLRGRVSIINPPYIIDVLDATVRKCHETLRATSDASQRSRMFIIVPAWTDAAFYRELEQSEFLAKKINNERGAHHFIDASARDRAIVATFATTMFVLARDLDEASREDYEPLIQVMREH